MTIMQGDIIKIDKKKLKEDKLPTKVVIRHLPPTMTLESFIEQTDPPTYDFISHIAPDKTLLPHIYSRAYINFCDMEDLFIFTQKFDGYVFLDSKGHEYPAIVEFAPFQRIPKQKSSSKRKDVKSGTIETDQYFTDFQEKVLEEREKAGTKSFKQHYFETTTENEEKHKITDTPLLQYLRNKNAEKEKKFREGKKVRKKTDEWRKMREDQSVRQNKKIEQDYNMSFSQSMKRNKSSKKKGKIQSKKEFSKDLKTYGNNQCKTVSKSLTSIDSKDINKQNYFNCYPTILEAREEKSNSNKNQQPTYSNDSRSNNSQGLKGLNADLNKNIRLNYDLNKTKNCRKLKITNDSRKLSKLQWNDIESNMIKQNRDQNIENEMAVKNQKNYSKVVSNNYNMQHTTDEYLTNCLKNILKLSNPEININGNDFKKSNVKELNEIMKDINIRPNSNELEACSKTVIENYSSEKLNFAFQEYKLEKRGLYDTTHNVNTVRPDENDTVHRNCNFEQRTADRKLNDTVQSGIVNKNSDNFIKSGRKLRNNINTTGSNNFVKNFKSHRKNEDPNSRNVLKHIDQVV